jgi:hypothetical protein
MPKPVYPALGTPERRFLDVLLAGTMYLHDEYVQDVGHPRLLALAGALRALGWDVQMKAVPKPTPEYPSRHVAFFFVEEYTLDAATGEEFDG